ncbi:hypothetical protein SAMN06265380_11185 [Ruegeria faecimaris]|uniref:Conjugal transfer pilus assembly protein TraV n=2 Tax=Ruegeria faecimaris TaxID=686389 RepID=A0A521EJ03_9RHOB|nr:hypothetical protein SAMN06265380_11185 [Ruegeria faecimaris]
MKHSKSGNRTRAKALAIALAALPATQASAYPIDCAIFLCLAGGWPGSPDCVAAKAEFIRRITPYPVEPPLQLWRCPMNASLNSSGQGPMERLETIKRNSASPVPELPSDSAFEPRVVDVSISSEAARAVYGQSNTTSQVTPISVDLSSPDFDVVRSIRVWDVRHYSYRRRSREGDCERSLDLVVGSYDDNVSFQWSDHAPAPIPAWLPLGNRCVPPSYFRGVGVEWTDIFGFSDYELIRY